MIVSCSAEDQLSDTGLLSSTDEFYPIRQEWQAVDSTTPNVSHFIYQDLNRNGVYDLGDRPMVDMAVRLTRPDNSFVIKRSNIHGFVNFNNSLTASPVDVNEPGKYFYEVLIPESWILTSDNAVQAGNYESRPNTRPGIIVDKVPTPAGLAQILSIRGRVVVRSASGEIVEANLDEVVVFGISPSGIKVEIPIDENGHFFTNVESGSWTIEARSISDDLYAKRMVIVENVPVNISSIILGDPPVEPMPNIGLIDFEDLTESIITKVPDGFGGLNWINLIVVDNEMYGGAGYINNTVSGKYVAYNSSGYPVTIWHDSAFDFYGAYFGVAWPSAQGEILKVRAWRDDQLVGLEEFELSAYGPFWFDAQYYSITKLELSTRYYWQFVVDDMVFGLQNSFLKVVR